MMGSYSMVLKVWKVAMNDEKSIGSRSRELSETRGFIIEVEVELAKLFLWWDAFHDECLAKKLAEFAGITV